MNELIMVAGMALVTFLIRYPTMVLVGKIPLPDRVFRALRYVPPAVLAAIIVPSVLMPDGKTVDFVPNNSYLVAGIIAVIISWRSKNLLLTIVLGMAIFLLLRLLPGM
ncbi:MAG: AzlD domain-containing protein [Chloroflexi bacterium]|nr:AzlD domain-containing protein [Chloroflexota bacterium]